MSSRPLSPRRGTRQSEKPRRSLPLGRLRGERGHCRMARVPTLAEEDAKRPNRERKCLVKELTRLANRMKGTLAWLGIRNFRPTLRNAAERQQPYPRRRALRCPRMSQPNWSATSRGSGW
jgi:transposase